MAAALVDWKIIVVSPSSSTLSSGSSWSSLRDHVHPGLWVDLRVSGEPRGGVVGSQVYIAARGFVNPQAVTTPSERKRVENPTWAHVAADFVKDLFLDDLVVAEPLFRELAARPSDLGVDFSEAGKVSRHTSRGPPLADPKLVRQLQDRQAWSGMRNPADLQPRWPELWRTMGKVADVIRKFRDKHPELRDLPAAFGDSPARLPPSEHVLRDLRCAVGRLFHLAPVDVDLHSWCSSWRFRLVAAVQRDMGDGDGELEPWLRDGAPMGITVPILPGSGCFPLFDAPAVLDPKTVLDMPKVKNHPSFVNEPAGHAAVESHLNAGFGILFESSAEASLYVGSAVSPAPLGCVTKVKDNGELKHRIIMDLKANHVNLACSTPERQVLPTLHAHGRDIAILAELLDKPIDQEPIFLQHMVLDFADAFMSIPLAPSEYAFNCCELARPVRRTRRAAHDHEPQEGKFIIWVVLGFGGKPNPLVFSRVASFAARTAQGLLRPRRGGDGPDHVAHGRVQLYVDDPAVSLAGSLSDNLAAADLIITWWLLLGIPLAWKKGVFTSGAPLQTHRWIGADFNHRKENGENVAVIMLPAAFVDKLFEQLFEMATGKGTTTDSELDVILGKCGRVAYVLPATRPFVAALWGALSGSRAAAASARNARGRPEAPPGRHANRRFASAARWLRTVLRPPVPAEALVPLEQVITRTRPTIDPKVACVQCDASPWGGGAVLFKDDVAIEFFQVTWDIKTAAKFNVQIGNPHGQTMWEYLVLYLSLLVWGEIAKDTGIAIMGDNLASLGGILNLRGKSNLHLITREISWRKTRLGWRFSVGHLPSELNKLADALSRTCAPHGSERRSFPRELSTAKVRQPPCMETWWISSLL